MIRQPELSVVLTCYKSLPFIDKCLKSLSCQSFQDFELIIVLDGEDYETHQICTKHKKIFDNFSLIVHPENLGVNRAISTGIKDAKGTFLVLISVDDPIISRDFFKLSVEFLRQETSCSLVFSDQATFSTDTPDSVTWLPLSLSEKPIYWEPSEIIDVFKGNQFHIGSNTVMYRKDRFIEYWTHFHDLQQYADWSLKTAMSFQDGAGYIPKHFVMTRIHEDSYSSLISRKFKIQYNLCRQLLLSEPFSKTKHLSSIVRDLCLFPSYNFLVYLSVIISLSRFDLLSFRFFLWVLARGCWHGFVKQIIPQRFRKSLKLTLIRCL